MAGVFVNGRPIFNERIHIRHGNQNLDFVSRHCLSHGKLIQVKRVIVINGSPQKIPQVTDWLAVYGCRCLNLVQLGERLRRKVRE